MLPLSSFHAILHVSAILPRPPASPAPTHFPPFLYNISSSQPIHEPVSTPEGWPRRWPPREGLRRKLATHANITLRRKLATHANITMCTKQLHLNPKCVARYGGWDDCYASVNALM